MAARKAIRKSTSGPKGKPKAKVTQHPVAKPTARPKATRSNPKPKPAAKAKLATRKAAARAKSRALLKANPNPPKPGALPVAERRGLSKKLDYGWHVMLVQSADGTADADAFLDRMVERGHIGGARRDVAADLFAGRVPRPMGPWGLLVRLKGHPWLHLVGDGLRREWPRELAAALGLRTALFGADGMTGTLLAEAHEGSAALVDFQAGLLAGGRDDPDTVYERDGVTGMTLGGSTLTTEWLRQFKSSHAAHDALARELGLYVPVLYKHGEGGKARLAAHDGKRLAPAHFERIDLVTFGAASTLDPTPASFDLARAVRAGDAAGVRAAIAAGADPRYMPDDDDPPLAAAFRLGKGTSMYSRPYEEVGRGQQLAVIEALLDGGAPPDPPGGEPGIHHVLENGEGGDERTIIAQLRLLLDRGADPNALGTLLRGDGQTPLHVAAGRGWLAVLKLLVSRGADASRPDRGGLTARQTLEARLANKHLGQPPKKLAARMLEFLAAAERGEADTSDVDELAERSWQEWQVKHKRWLAQADAALKQLGMTHEQLLKHDRGE